MVSIILFDGVCTLCAASVRFIVKRDPRGHFAFASLQSEFAAKEITRVAPKTTLPDSIVLVEDGRLHLESTAALRIARRLRFPWPILAIGLVVPRFLRDPIYRFIARRRYRWFGKQDTCMVPSPELESRFLR